MKFRFVYYPAQIVFSNRCNVNCHGHHHIVVQTSRFHGPAHELQSDIQTISNQSAKSESYDTFFLRYGYTAGEIGYQHCNEVIIINKY